MVDDLGTISPIIIYADRAGRHFWHRGQRLYVRAPRFVEHTHMQSQIIRTDFQKQGLQQQLLLVPRCWPKTFCQYNRSRGSHASPSCRTAHHSAAMSWRTSIAVLRVCSAHVWPGDFPSTQIGTTSQRTYACIWWWCSMIFTGQAFAGNSYHISSRPACCCFGLWLRQVISATLSFRKVLRSECKRMFPLTYLCVYASGDCGSAHASIYLRRAKITHSIQIKSTYSSQCNATQDDDPVVVEDQPTNTNPLNHTHFQTFATLFVLLDLYIPSR